MVEPSEAGYPPGVPRTYDYPAVPLTRLLDDAAQDFPYTDAVDAGGHRLTYHQVTDQVDRVATVLADAGVAAGDRVATLLPTSPQLLVTSFAAWRLGAVVVLLDPDGQRDSLAAALEGQRCVVVVCAAAAYARLSALKGAVPAVRHVLVTGVEDYLPFPRNVVLPVSGRRDRRYVRVPRRERVSRFKEEIRRTAPGVGQAPTARGATAAVIDGVALSHEALVASAFALRLWVPDVQAGGETLLLAAPAWRPFGFAAVLGLGVLAAATIAMEPGSEPLRLLSRARRRRPTLLAADRRALSALETGAGDALEALRVALVDEVVDPDLAARLHESTGARLRGGMAGPAGLVTANPVYGLARLGSAGLPLPDVRVAALGTDDAPLGVGSLGALAVSGPAAPGPGWWSTGRRGRVDRDGFVWVGDPAEAEAGTATGRGAPESSGRDG